MKEIDKNILVQALDQLPVGTLLIDARREHWPVVYMNGIVGQLTGLDVGTLIGCPWRGLLMDPEELAPQRERLLGSPGLVVRHLRQRWQSRSGEPVDMVLQVTPLYSRPGQPAYWLVTVDADQRPEESAGEDTLRVALRDAQLRLRQLDRSDPITGLYNRQAFLEVVQRDWGIAAREQRRVSVIVFQVDAFDRYRDLYGKHAADSCLRKVAHAITGSLRRAGDLAARVADNRFAALVGSSEESRIREFAAQIARKVRELAIHHPRSPAGRYVTVSLGFGSEVPAWGESDNTLLQQAEAAIEQVAGERPDERPEQRPDQLVAG
jgi:diguanylate cyclase (GGDEF)-like protein